MPRRWPSRGTLFNALATALVGLSCVYLLFLVTLELSDFAPGLLWGQTGAAMAASLVPLSWWPRVTSPSSSSSSSSSSSPAAKFATAAEGSWTTTLDGGTYNPSDGHSADGAKASLRSPASRETRPMTVSSPMAGLSGDDDHDLSDLAATTATPHKHAQKTGGRQGTQHVIRPRKNPRVYRSTERPSSSSPSSSPVVHLDAATTNGPTDRPTEALAKPLGHHHEKSASLTRTRYRGNRAVDFYKFKYNPGHVASKIEKPPFPPEIPVQHVLVPNPLPDYSQCSNWEGTSGGMSTQNSQSSCPPHVANVVFFKTHKCASTTISSLLFRFGVQHQLRFYVSQHVVDFTFQPAAPSNISLYHHRVSPGWYNFTEITSWYRFRVPNAHFLTIVRDPVKRSLSEWYYLLQPDYHNRTLAEAIRPDFDERSPRWRNLATDLGIYSDEEMDFFMREGYKQFSLVAVVEKFDESMVLLRRLFGWRTEDILYIPLLDSCVDRRRTWDRMEVQCATRVDQSPETLEALRQLMRYDYEIYNLFVRELDKKLAAQPPDFWDEVKLYKETVAKLHKDCPRSELTTRDNSQNTIRTTIKQSSSSHPATNPCALYHVNDLQLEEIIRLTKGTPSLVDVSRVAGRLYGYPSSTPAANSS